MKGCYFFQGDIALNTCTFSKNTVDRFDIAMSEEDCVGFWKQFVKEDDYFLFAKFFEGKRTQISGAFSFYTRERDLITMQCILQEEEINGKLGFTGVLTELSLGYSTRSVSRLKEGNGFRAILNNLKEDKKEYGILIIGIDNFKDINELYSYTIGDEIIHSYTQKIEDVIEKETSLYQLDGDTFGILCPNASIDSMSLLFRNLQQLSQPIYIERAQTPISFTISGGIAMYPQNGNNGEELFRNARVAFLEAKAQGKNQYVIYNDEISSRAVMLAKLMVSLKESVRENFKGFSLCYQPLVHADSNELFGCEVLLRWKHDNFPNGVSPVEFIPLLEKSGMIIEVGKWVLSTAFAQKQEWDQIFPNLEMSINVAAEQFRVPNFVEFVLQEINKYHLDPKLITLELTESGEIKDADEINKTFDFFRSQQIKIALDDFGTGYDSLNCLRVLSSDMLKIDRSFLERITYNIADQQILLCIIQLCQRMKIDVCIEGVENAQVNEMLKAYGAKLLQGYFFSKPVDAEAFTKYLHQHKAMYHLEGKDSNAILAQNHTLVYSEVKSAQAMNMDELVDNAYGGIFQVGMDEEFTFLTCNEGYRKLLGYTAKEIEEKFANKALGFVHPDDVQYVSEEIRRQLSIGDTLVSEFRVVRKDGTPIWIVGTGSVVRSHKCNPSLVVMIVANDEAKKKALLTQQQSKRYEAILNNVPGGIKCVRFDESFTISYISPSFLSLLGYTLDDLKNDFDNKYVNMVYEEDIIRVNADVFDQLKTSDVVTLHYRSYCKDGSLIWLETVSRLMPPSEDGEQYFYSSVVNVTNTLSEEEKNKTINFKERFQIAAKRWGDVLFEIDLKTDYISFSEAFEEIFHYALVQKLETFKACLHQDDLRLFEDAIMTMKKVGEVMEIEVRIKNHEERYIWCSLMFDVPEYVNGDPYVLIGKLKNIHEEKLREDELIKMSEVDSVTSLFNKGTIEAKIREQMEATSQAHALFMIDIDDFKTINDSYGHLFGDRLLLEAANRLRSVFGEEAMIGRAGGDEFLVFTPYVSEENIEKVATNLLHEVQKEFVFDEKCHCTKLSVGIACYPKDGSHFHDLFAKADAALYRVKLQSKNGYSIY